MWSLKMWTMSPIILLLALAAPLPFCIQAKGSVSCSKRSPIIFFPYFGGSKIRIKVDGQTFAPDCPKRGTFDVFNEGYVSSLPKDWTELCAVKMLRLIPTFNAAGRPVSFSSPPGVTSGIINYGHPDCTATTRYKEFFDLFTTNGYTPGKDLVIGCYDWRLSPNVGLAPSTPSAIVQLKNLILQTYKANNGVPVFLSGHSNGPLYPKMLLDSVSPAFKEQYIAGFIPLAGNWPGQGAVPSLLLAGFSFNAAFAPNSPAVFAAGPVLETFPSWYLSSADPKVFGNRITIVKDNTTGVAYTPLDYSKFYKDAGLSLAAKLHPYFNGQLSYKPPGVDVYNIQGVGVQTVVGQVFNVPIGKARGTAATDFFFRDGDGNQEDITNFKDYDWARMDPCHRFVPIVVLGDPLNYPDIDKEPAFHYNLAKSSASTILNITCRGKLPPLCPY